MGHNDRLGERGGGKPPASPGISPAEARELTAQVSALSFRLEKVERFLRDHFDEKNQWSATVRDWVGKKVVVELTQRGSLLVGELLWLDRYTICVKSSGSGRDPLAAAEQPKPMVVHKAAIALIYLAD